MADERGDKNADIVFYNSDHDPFGQRVWIALLEKRAPFELVEVSPFTKPAAFTDVVKSGQLPAISYGGAVLDESIDMCRFVDDVASSEPLVPGAPLDRYRCNVLMRRYSEPLVAAWFAVLTAGDGVQRDVALPRLLDVLGRMGKELANGGGPFFFGDHFTLADAVAFPFVERMLIALPYYRRFSLPGSDTFAAVHRWIDACYRRESVKTTTGPRSVESLRTHPYEARDRRGYILEVQRMYAEGTVEETRARLAKTRPPLAQEA